MLCFIIYSFVQSIVRSFLSSRNRGHHSKTESLPEGSRVRSLLELRLWQVGTFRLLLFVQSLVHSFLSSRNREHHSKTESLPEGSRVWSLLELRLWQVGTLRLLLPLRKALTCRRFEAGDPSMHVTVFAFNPYRSG